jgi:thiol-disulfide isomerase/thioredoxin
MSGKKHRRKRKIPSPIVPAILGIALLGFGILSLASQKAGIDTSSLESVKPAQVRSAAPELSLQNIEGETESLADHLGEVVLVNNWATWCPPCKAEMPILVSYYNDHKADGFSVIAVEAGEPADVVSQYAQSLGMNFPVWLDPDRESLRAIGNATLPNSYVIDRSGMVRLMWTGEITMAMLEKYVTPLIAEDN